MSEALRSSWVAVAAASAISIAAALLLVPFDVRTGSSQAQTRLALDTAAATIGLLLAFLMFGRLQDNRRVRDGLLALFLLLLGGANALLSVVPRLLLVDIGPFAVASAVAGLAAGIVFAGAAWSGDGVVPAGISSGVLALVLVVVTVVALALAYGVGATWPGSGEAASADTFGASTSGALTTAQGAAAAAFFAAMVGWLRKVPTGERLLVPLAAAAVLGGASRAAFVKSTSVLDAWSTTGTVLRFLFYACLVLAAGVEIRSSWRYGAELAVLEERRRIARDLHDGIAQELAFAATQARFVRKPEDQPEQLRLIAGSTQRALEESRRAIAALTRPLDEPLAVSVAQTAEEVCRRYDVALDLDLDPSLAVPADVREPLLRILGEAVSNAVRHGNPSLVRVRLSGAEGLQLRVEDDGTGFDVETEQDGYGRFGLGMMRERATALGGTFGIRSSILAGTSVELTLPPAYSRASRGAGEG